MNTNSIDFLRLVGFDQVVAAGVDAIDFRSDALAAKIGAKRAEVEPEAHPDEADRRG